jgi:hypothetical protein
MRIADLQDAPNWLTIATTLDEDVVIEDGKVVWRSGMWLGGTWLGGESLSKEKRPK